ncbi:TetR/AcrR family transcriptional regulator [Streptacidiphilus neutrinimicus]|uniref:TetR/AcrR family transcriptional regulator n=1 Tax=Streptacidiphilus neutrinimicus TaxID=105420 RepID=UPI001378EAD7|nr:TetR/AcrR family transcriptional regulator [Streptacidiphilus neutrinimicus]
MTRKQTHRSDPGPPAPMRDRLVEAAARILAEHGPSSLSARRLAAEAGTSTMSVYTHFGSMDDVVQEVLTASTLNLHRLLERVPRGDDPVAHVALLGRVYRSAALRRPHIFAAASAKGLLSQGDAGASTPPRGFTWQTLVQAVQDCLDAGRYRRPQDSELGAYLHWASVHGFVTLELSGMAPTSGVSGLPFETMLEGLAIGAGDDPARAVASVAASRDTFADWNRPTDSDQEPAPAQGPGG